MAAGTGGSVDTRYRLTPTMRSRKLQVVRFVEDYVARWGQWPSYREIGEAMGIERLTARDAVKRAVRDGLLQRAPGSRRGQPIAARLIDPTPAVLLHDLGSAGVIVMETTERGGEPTFCALPVSPPFRHIAEDD